MAIDQKQSLQLRVDVLGTADERQRGRAGATTALRLNWGTLLIRRPTNTSWRSLKDEVNERATRAL